jgi:hypothetical protein
MLEKLFIIGIILVENIQVGKYGKRKLSVCCNLRSLTGGKPRDLSFKPQISGKPEGAKNSITVFIYKLVGCKTF